VGTFRVRIGVGREEHGHFEPVEVLVDTGATYTVLPRALLEEIGVVPHTRAPFVVADGRELELEIGRVWVRVDGQQELSLVVFGDAALLGAYTLEALRLAPDPVGRRLMPVPALLMRAVA
jgi:aspartyl protease family protein